MCLEIKLKFSQLTSVMFVMGKINWGLKSFVHLHAFGDSLGTDDDNQALLFHFDFASSTFIFKQVRYIYPLHSLKNV